MTDKTERPLSPHLQIYRPQMTSVLSILHRACGFALAVGTIPVVWLLVAAATGPDSYNVFMSFATMTIGRLLLLGWSIALFFHMSNGIRHLIWDTGRMLSIEKATLAGYFVLVSTVILTVLTWWFACPFKGGS